VRVIKSYILSVAVTAVISSIISMLSPAKWSKYVGMITGLAVVICIGQPVFSLLNEDLFKNIQFQTEVRQTNGNDILNQEIKKELAKKVEEDIINRLKDEFALTVSVEADIAVNMAGEIEGIRKITFFGDKPDAAAVGRIRDIYGVREVVYGGNKKNIKKTE
jgi:hypothetical protein